MKILLATDGSEYSKAAIEKCCKMFGDTKDKFVKVVSVYENVFPVAGEPFAISAEYYQELENDSKAQAEKYAADAVDLIKQGCGGIAAETEVINGSPERAIIETAQKWGADLIIVGSHGRGFWGRMMIGSVSDAVMHHAPCSVLIVRA